MKLTKIVTLVLSLSMTVSLCACGSTATSTTTSTITSEGTAAPSTSMAGTDTVTATGVKNANVDPVNTEVTDKKITIGLASEPPNLWGAGTGTTENEVEIICGVYLDTLVTKDQTTGEILPNLATDWSWTDDTHLKFTLRDDVKMTDESLLTADDVVYTVGVWKEKSATSDTGRFIAGVTKDDDTHVTIEFNMAVPALLDMLTWTQFGIVSEDEVNAVGGIEAASKNPVMGSGKYKFKEWKSGQSITLERNDNYWNDDYKGFYQTIVFTFTNDAASREMAVESGDAQVAYDMPVSQAASFIRNDKVGVIAYGFGQVYHLWYNMMENHKTSELALRQAIDKSLDFDAIAQVGTAGFGKASLGYFTEDSSTYNQSYKSEERAIDIEGAKKILEDAGIPTDGSIELSGLCTQDTVPVYTVIQENLRAIGITFKIDSLDTAAFVEGAFGGDYDLICAGDYTAARYPTIFCFLQQVNIDSGFVIGGPKITTPEIDSAITELVEEKDTDKAKEESGALEQKLKEQCIVSNLYTEMKASIVGSTIKGYSTRDRGFLDPTNFYE